VDLTGFDIFRNNMFINHVTPSTNFYTDNTSKLEDGVYRYCVKPVYPFSCTFEDNCFETYISVGINIYSSTLNFYPNPATNSINISGDRVAELKMYNSIGQLILSQHNTNVINVSGLTNGIYMLAVETSTGNIIHKKIIINH
jgi:hypothetical protein